ncbi:hypothetical protein [Chromobacterium haemolyticum]|uniref:hypothetical protein n=1 Tax=Chromobacterium haemolyticum TaxID=394935 RepID=UPI0002DAFC86|nr:hypothetical protein [Chromobacterium haemolyticum]
MKRILLSGLALLAILSSAQAWANCVNLNGRSYCSEDGGIALVQRGQAMCGKGECAIDEFGNVLCSPYPGGGVVRANGVTYAGPGACLLSRDGNPYCAKQPRGSCQQDADGNVRCDGGWVREKAERPERCR